MASLIIVISFDYAASHEESSLLEQDFPVWIYEGGKIGADLASRGRDSHMC